MAGAARLNCCHLGAFRVHPDTTMHHVSHFMQSHIRKVYACLAVTCHLRFWQHARGLLRATAAVTRGWNGYQNKSQHRKHTPSIAFRHLPPNSAIGFTVTATEGALFYLRAAVHRRGRQRGPPAKGSGTNMTVEAT